MLPNCDISQEGEDRGTIINVDPEVAGIVTEAKAGRARMIQKMLVSDFGGGNQLI